MVTEEGERDNRKARDRKKEEVERKMWHDVEACSRQ